MVIAAPRDERRKFYAWIGSAPPATAIAAFKDRGLQLEPYSVEQVAQPVTAAQLAGVLIEANVAKPGQLRTQLAGLAQTVMALGADIGVIADASLSPALTLYVNELKLVTAGTF